MRGLVLVIILIAVSSLHAGDEPYWEPYQFKGTEHFKYEIVQQDNEDKQEGWYIIDIKKAGEKYKLYIEGKLGDNEGSMTTTVESVDDISGAILAQMFLNPWLAPLSITLFSNMWATAYAPMLITSGWEVGSKWSHKDKEGNKITVEIPSECKYAGQKGRKILVKKNDKNIYESCIAHGVALPIYVKFIGDEGELYEMKLVEYKD